MRFLLVLGVAICVLASFGVDAAFRRAKRNKCKAQEKALKVAGFGLCRAKLSQIDNMLNSIEEVECFEYLKDATLGYLVEVARNYSMSGENIASFFQNN